MSVVKNKNKIVTLTPTQNSQDENFGWKRNINRILTSIRKDFNESHFIIDTSQFSDYNVHNTIELIMDKYPEIKTANSSESAIKSALKTVDSLTGNWASKIYEGAKSVAGGVHDVFKAVDTESYNVDGTTNISSTFNPWVENIPAWNGGQGFQSIICTFNFSMGQYGLWDARQEVVNPIMNLMAPTIPRIITDFTITPPYPNAMQMIKEVFLSLFAAFKNNINTGNVFSSLSSEMMKFYNSFTYTVQFGNLYTFYNMLIKNCEMNFSSETDQYGNPISGSIKLMMDNIVPPALSYSSGINSFQMKGGK